MSDIQAAIFAVEDAIPTAVQNTIAADEEEADGTEEPKAKRARKAKPARTFHPEVENLLRLMYTATGNAIRKGLSASAGASADAPLGNLSDTQLNKGAELLDAVEVVLKGKKPSRDALIKLTNEVSPVPGAVLIVAMLFV